MGHIGARSPYCIGSARNMHIAKFWFEYFLENELRRRECWRRRSAKVSRGRPRSAVVGRGRSWSVAVGRGRSRSVAVGRDLFYEKL